jgi:hypothetical protein
MYMHYAGGVGPSSASMVHPSATIPPPRLGISRVGMASAVVAAAQGVVTAVMF